MIFIKEGEKGKALCENCGLTTTTYKLTNLNFNDNSGTVKDLLAGVCDTCNHVVTIPAQSTSQIKLEYNKVRKAIELRVPAHYIDILSFACTKIDSNLDEGFFKILILFYINYLNKNTINDYEFKRLLNSNIAKAKASKRISIKISEKSYIEFNKLFSKSGLKNKSDMIRSIILKINEDIIQAKKPKHIEELKTLASVYC